MQGNKDSGTELSDLLNYAKRNVPFYKRLEGSCLTDFPVITKQDILGNYDAFLSQEYINSKDLHWVSTSGSTGTPFKACQNRDKRYRTIADLIYFHNMKLETWRQICFFKSLDFYLRIK